MNARPLKWYKPTDHPQDDEDAVCMAHGIGGRYSITKQIDGTVLLWLASDGFIWREFPDIKAAKAAAENDWQECYAAAAQLESAP